MAKKKINFKIIVIAILIAIIALFFIGKYTGIIGKEKGIEIEIDKPIERQITEIISANGKIQPVTEVKISPDVSGEIVELNVIEGQKVEKGFLLLKIKPDVYISIKERAEASLNSSKAQKEQIEAQLIQAKQNYDRNKILMQGQAITQAEWETASSQYDNIKAQLKMAEFGIASATAALKESEENLQKTTIYAPMAGTVSLLNVELGERVVGTGQMAGTEILRIADLSQMEALSEVNENDIVRVNLGDTANVEVDAFTGKIFKGVVTRIANTAKATTSADQVTNFEVRVYIIPESYADISTDINPDPLRPGMSSTVDIITSIKKVLSVPIQSVTTRDIDGATQEVVFIYRPDSSIVEIRSVKTGIQDTRFIEMSGVDSLEQIVSGPYNTISKKLNDRSSIYIKEEKK